METQLVRLDKPYNIICGSEGRFGLHIATLIVVKEVQSKDEDGLPQIVTEACTYPVVAGGYGMDGEVWMKSELKNCLAICREGEPVGLYTLIKVVEFYSKDRGDSFLLSLPGRLDLALQIYGSKFVLPQDSNKRTISDYEVCLEFTENNDGRSCMVYATKESDFYFYDYFDNEPPFSYEHTNLESIDFLAKLRDSYISAFHFEGIRSITFTTKDAKYQWFVDKLNSKKPDAAGV